MIGDLAALRPEYGVEDRQDFGPKRPEMGQDHPDILPTAAQDSMERVTKRAFQGAAGEAAIRFHMADHRLDGTSTPQVAPERWGHPALLPGDVDRLGLGTVTTIAAIHEGPLRTGVRQDFHLLQCLTQRVPVIGVTRHRAHADNKPFPVGRRHRHFGRGGQLR